MDGNFQVLPSSVEIPLSIRRALGLDGRYLWRIRARAISRVFG